MRRKIILMTGGTETLDFFSRQLNDAFLEMGYITFLFDQRREEESAEMLYSFVGEGDSILITFNFDGIHYETSLFDCQGNYIWHQYNIPCINICVDHPLFYPELFEIHPDWFYQVSIDKTHDLFMKRFYPDILRGPFLPLAGTSLYPDGNYPAIKDRPYDILFTGNYTDPKTYNNQICRMGPEYEQFYRNILNDLIDNPNQPDDQVIERHLLLEMPDSTMDQLRQGINSMLFLDIYIRFYFRGLVIQTLIDSGLCVHCVGQGWENLNCNHPENLTWESDLHSYGCLLRQSQAKISLNVMPWFKDGAHDRIFNAMANGSVCVTDSSVYLKSELTDQENVIFFDLKEIDKLPGKIRSLLQHPQQLETLSQNAFSYTMQKHTWKNRAQILQDQLLQFFK